MAKRVRPLGILHTEETKRKISESNKGKHSGPNASTGRPKGSVCVHGHPLSQGKNRQWCKTCKSINTKKWIENNPEKAEASRRNTHLKHDFKITLEDYHNLWDLQGGLCAACGEPLPRREDGYSPVDHDHKTQKIRGVVHTKCNRGIGLFDDDPDRMRKVADYLERKQKNDSDSIEFDSFRAAA